MVELVADEPALVALGTGWYPRWRARAADGRAVPVYACPATDGGALRVPCAWLAPGQTTFTVDGALPSDGAGRWLAWLALALALAIVGAWSRRPWRRRCLRAWARLRARTRGLGRRARVIAAIAIAIGLAGGALVGSRAPTSHLQVGTGLRPTAEAWIDRRRRLGRVQLQRGARACCAPAASTSTTSPPPCSATSSRATVHHPLHTVVRGDTLWDISWYYFNDPWQWPKVWSYNPQISNPHWIYPGDLVRLLPRGVYVPVTTADPEGDPVRTSMPGPVRRSSLTLRDVAFVDAVDLEEAVRIDGSPDEKLLLATGDSVYLAYPKDKPPTIGERLSIYKEEQAVAKDGKKAGAYVRILGEVEVVSVKKDKRARGVITDARHEIERGDLVGPLVRELTTLPPVAPTVDAQGSIVAMLTRDQLIGESEIVFLDVGTEEGLEVGNRLYVVRRGDAAPGRADIARTGQDDRRYPARMLGEVSVVDVGKHTSMAIVTLSVHEMGIGDIVMMQKALPSE
ncbi:MAG: LysM peptidoglycan-binding domain-containing protein [Kofleriaceae bacterium]